MSEVIMYGAARPLPDDGKPAKVRRLGDPVIVTGPTPTGEGTDTVYETKIILPGARVELPVEPPATENAGTPGDAPASGAATSAPEAASARRAGR